MKLDKAKARRLSEFYASIAFGAPGAELQVLCTGGGALESRWLASVSGPTMASIIEQWRVAMPLALKPVDLSVLIKSKIDCTFGSSKYWTCVRGPLQKIVRGAILHTRYRDTATNLHDHCQPRMNYMHAWQGGRCPLPEGIMVKVHRRSDAPVEGPATHFEWQWSISDTFAVAGEGDIIAFEILGLSEGFCWPWDVRQKSPSLGGAEAHTTQPREWP